MSQAGRQAIQEDGGLVGLVGVGKALGVSKQRAHAVSKHETFPTPIVIDGKHVWPVDEVKAWRKLERPRKRKASRPKAKTVRPVHPLSQAPPLTLEEIEALRQTND